MAVITKSQCTFYIDNKNKFTDKQFCNIFNITIYTLKLIKNVCNEPDFDVNHLNTINMITKKHTTRKQVNKSALNTLSSSIKGVTYDMMHAWALHAGYKNVADAYQHNTMLSCKQQTLEHVNKINKCKKYTQ